jgi:hypothetical protein
MPLNLPQQTPSKAGAGQLDGGSKNLQINKSRYVDLFLFFPVLSLDSAQQIFYS